MKKLFALIAFIAMATSFSADAYIYVTRCGIAVQTVSPSFFSTQAEWVAYQQELDEIYCKDKPDSGEHPGIIVIQPVNPNPNPLP